MLMKFYISAREASNGKHSEWSLTFNTVHLWVAHIDSYSTIDTISTNQCLASYSLSIRRSDSDPRLIHLMTLIAHAKLDLSQTALVSLQTAEEGLVQFVLGIMRWIGVCELVSEMTDHCSI